MKLSSLIFALFLGLPVPSFAASAKLAAVSDEFTSAREAQESVLRVGCGFGRVSQATLERVMPGTDLLAVHSVTFQFSDGATETSARRVAMGHPLLGTPWVFQLGAHPCLESVTVVGKAFSRVRGKGKPFSQIDVRHVAKVRINVLVE